MSPEALIRTAQLILALALLIILHEGGHFLTAKMFGIRVEKFFLFFDYKFHLISTKDAWLQRLFPRLKNWETEYGIGWIPLGGYVKIAGMIDESMDTEQLKQPVQPWEFRAKRPWQRLIVMLGGVIVNMITAMVIYAGIAWHSGSDTIPMARNFDHGFYFNRSAQEMGFMQGDKILRIDTAGVATYDRGQMMLDMAEARTVTVSRLGVMHDSETPADAPEVTITLPDEFPILSLLKETPPFFAPLIPAVIDSVTPGSAADKAGIVGGTRLHAISDAQGVLTDIFSWNGFDEIMSRRLDMLKTDGCTAADSLQMRRMDVLFMLPGDTVCTAASLTLDADCRMGVFRHFPELDFDHTDYTFIEAVPRGCLMGWQTLASYVDQMKYLFSREGAESVGSFITIGNLFPETWNWLRFWGITAFLSVILAFMNVLPIPGLDGGHAFFTLIEMLTGYTFSEKFQERALTIGFTLILALMALAIYNDIVNHVLN